MDDVAVGFDFFSLRSWCSGGESIGVWCCVSMFAVLGGEVERQCSAESIASFESTWPALSGCILSSPVRLGKASETWSTWVLL